MSSSDAPSAAVRTMTPPSFTSRRLRMSLSRVRSSSSSRRDTPRPSPCGTSTTKRPGSEICVVSRAPFVFIGSLTAWTRIVWPREIEVLDLAPVALLELGADDLVDVEEAVLLEADLDERGLHPRQDVVDAAEVDVAGDRAAFRPLEVDLRHAAVLEDGDAALADVDGDEQLALRGRQRRTALRLARAGAATVRGGVPAAARARGAGAASPRPSSFARARLPLRRRRASSARARHGCRGGAWAWSDRWVLRRPPSRPLRSARARASPRARVRPLDAGRRKISSGNGTRASRNSFGWARAGYLG